MNISKTICLFILTFSIFFSCQNKPKITTPKSTLTDKDVLKDSTPKESGENKDIIKYNTASDSIIYLYLTFDDGPNNGTSNLINILNDHYIECSLFIIGKHVYGSKFQKELFELYHNHKNLELCNHSFSHANNQYKIFYQNPKRVADDFKQCHDSLKFSNKISRAPGRNMWSIEGDSCRFRTTTPEAIKLKEEGFKMVGWDVDWDFKRIKNHSDFMVRLKEIEASKYPESYPSYQSGHIVILMHDQSFVDSNNCEEFIKFITLIKTMPQKYKFKKISAYPLLISNTM